MRIATIIILLPLLLLAFSARKNPTIESLPPVIVWAWERPENLTFLDPQTTGVAFLAKTITLHDDKIAVKPRLQPLKLARDTKLIAVVRIEIDRSHLHFPQLSSSKQRMRSLCYRVCQSCKSTSTPLLPKGTSIANCCSAFVMNSRPQSGS